MSKPSAFQQVLRTPLVVTRFWFAWAIAMGLGGAWAGVAQFQLAQLIDNQSKTHRLLIAVETTIIQIKMRQEFNKQQFSTLSDNLLALKVRVNDLSTNNQKSSFQALGSSVAPGE